MKIFWLGICGAVAVLGSFHFYLQFLPLSSVLTREKSVASLLRAQGTINYRPASSLLWHPITAGFPLQTGDAVLAGPESQAEILWSTGEKLKLAAGMMFLVSPDLRGLSVPPPLVDMPNPRARDVAGQRDR